MVLSVSGALGIPAVARAHVGRTKRVEVRVGEGDPSASVWVPRLEAAVALGLGPDPAPAVLASRAEPIAARLAADLALGTDRVSCVVVSEPKTRVDAEHLRVDWTYRCPEQDGLRLTDRSLADAPDHETHLVTIVRNQRRLTILRTAEPVELTPPHWSTTAIAFVYEGVVHLVTGYDHLLFLMTLVVGAGWAGRRRGGRAVFWDSARIVTAFTVGHSLTLGWSAFGGLAWPSQPVEALIALSIVVAAALNVARPESASGRPWLALGFGLIHGFGFSSVLAEVGLPASQRLLALLSFNLGIEVAQLAVVAVVLIPLVELARQRWYRPVIATGGSALAALFGLLWFAERTSLL